jgi:polyisoprenoid-binding protein YceI
MKFWRRATARGSAAPSIAAALTVAALLASCQAPPPKPGPTVAPPQAPAVPPPAGRRYRVVPAASAVRILVYRGGSLSKLGHNHVITSHDLSGTVVVPEDPTQTQFEIVMPVAPLTVDEPEERNREGADFSTQVSDTAREGTHKNMMKTEVLDGDNYPAVTVRSTRIARSGDDYDVVFEVELRGLKYQLEAPVHVVLDGGQLVATGEFAVKQSDIGITPFTAALGALAIRDEIRLKFDIVTIADER